MYFSERYGYEQISEKLNWETMTNRLRNRLWNIVYPLLDQEITIIDVRAGRRLVTISDKLKDLWKDFLAKPIDFIETQANPYYQEVKLYDLGLKQIIPATKIKEDFLKFKWFEVYDLIEYLYNNFFEGNNSETYVNEVKRILIEEKAPYRFVNGLITPITDKEEIKELVKALNVPQDKYKPVKEHLEKGLSLMSDRENPDYANSIKESISALESIAQIQLGGKGTLGELIKKLDVHPALKQGFNNIYGWTSDEGGIRHGKTGEPLEPGLAEARYMLITSSAFINYLVVKEEGE
ncbi:MAG: AbiJ-NTD4 domain-containing protein [Thermodesulfobacteriota bacterium]